MERVVVGVDGGQSSRRALEWAAAEARNRDAELLVVHAWTMPPTAYGTSLVPHARAFESKRYFESSARKSVEQLLADIDLTGVRVHLRVAEGDSGAVLVSESDAASMVVVGHRRRSALSEFVLGSTTQYVNRHSRAPVVVVPETAPSPLLSPRSGARPRWRSSTS